MKPASAGRLDPRLPPLGIGDGVLTQPRGERLGWALLTSQRHGGKPVTDPQERPGQGGLTLLPPRLTFACELDRARLAELFADRRSSTTCSR
jgi:hypothetical protein